MDELELKVVKSIFSVKKVSEVEQINFIDENKLEVNEEDLEKLLNSFAKTNEPAGNPLFIENNVNTQNNSNEKKKIRV